MAPADRERRLTLARSRLIVRQPFFGALAHRLPLTWSDATETAGTDGQRLYLHPDYVDTLEDETLVTLLAHEIAHVALLHPHRMKGRDHAVANRAMDYVVNQLLADCGMPLPDGVLLDPSLGHLSVEEVYRRLMEQEKPEPEPEPEPDQDQDQEQDQDNGAGDGDQPNQDNDDEDDDEDEEEETDGENEEQSETESESETDDGGQDGETEADDESETPESQPAPESFGEVMEAPPDAYEGETTAAVAEAATIAKAAGAMPGALAAAIAEQTEPRLDWREELARFCDANGGRADYSFRKRSRRASQDIILPALCTADEPGRLLIVLDSSGSCYAWAGAFLAEVAEILRAFPMLTAEAIACDTAVEGPWSLEEVPTDRRAYGGTRFRPAFDYAESGEPLKGLVYFTDGYAPDVNACASEIPTLWILTNTDTFDPPTGEIARLDPSGAL